MKSNYDVIWKKMSSHDLLWSDSSETVIERKNKDYSMWKGSCLW
jgi:hypothetical protein